MKYFEIFSYILALCFALGVTQKIFFPNIRQLEILPIAVVIAIYWWLVIGLAVVGYYKVWHLYWLMPMTNVVISKDYGWILKLQRKESIKQIGVEGAVLPPVNLFVISLIHSSVIIVPILAILIYFSN